MRQLTAAPLAFVVALLAAGVAGAQQRPAEHLPPTPRVMPPSARTVALPIAPRGGIAEVDFRRMILRAHRSWPYDILLQMRTPRL